MTDTTPRREQTRMRLVEAAIDEFAVRGLDATSVEQLCEAAGFSRGAFYSNFATKDDLCLAIMEFHRDQVLAGLTQVFDNLPEEADVEWVTGEALSDFFRIVAPTEHFQRTLVEIRLRSTRNPALAARVEQVTQETRPGMHRFIDDLAQLNQVELEQFGDPEIATRISQYEMAYKMQTSVPELTDLSKEPAHTFELYGEEARKPGTFAANCLLARRLAERGVRFIQLFHRGWDQHNDLPKQIRGQSKDTDRASATVKANGRSSSPAMPETRPIGMNTAAVARVEEVIAPPTSPTAVMIASRLGVP